MAINEIHLYDEGTQLIATVKDEDDVVVDISTASVLKLSFLKPDETTSEKTATLYTDGTDGKMYYATASGFLDQVGYWEMQGYVEIGSSKWHSDIDRFKVHRNI